MTAATSPKLIEPPPAHRMDEARLFAYLRDHVQGFAEPIAVLQFQGGQSNPTFLIETAARSYVLRKKPPGILLPSAHQIDREYRVQKALGSAGFPVPRMLHYCADGDVVGTEFYVMEFLQGRVFNDAMMPQLARSARAEVQTAMFESIAALHGIDYAGCGLADYGRPANYLARQIRRLRQAYEAVATEDLPAMTALTQWLERHIPADEATSIVHGDFRLGNMVLHPSEPRIIAVLDWELSTVGHPMADLAYCCICFHMPHIEGSDYSGYAGTDLASHGLLREMDCLEIYRRRSGRDAITDWNFHLGFALFRSAAILEGVYARALGGNAVDPRATQFHAMTKLTAELGWQIVQSKKALLF